MNRWRIGRWLLPVLVGFAFGMPALADKLEVGMDPPDYLGKDADGKPVRISEHRGKIVIVSFWAVWCPPCRKELPVLDSLQKAAGVEKMRVFSVNWKEPRDTFRGVRRRLKDTSLTLLHDASGRIGAQYGVEAIPHMVIVGRDGKIASVHRGYSEAMIGPLIEEINTLWREGGEQLSQAENLGLRVPPAIASFFSGRESDRGSYSADAVPRRLVASAVP